MQTTKNHLGNTPNPNIKQISNKYTYYLSVDAMKYIHYKIAQKLIMVLHMSFDKFVLAVESCDLSQADKSIIRVSSFPKLTLQTHPCNENRIFPV